MQYLLKERLEHVEQRIEETVNSMIIDRYKSEMRTVYNEGIAGMDFAEARLNRTDSGFRARLPGAPVALAGTRRSSHDAICQSPRIQRWRRLTSAQ